MLASEGADTWESILGSCSVDRPKDPPTYRIVLCGAPESGKRSWVNQVLGMSDRSGSIPRSHGGGIDYSYLDVRRSDAVLLHTLEFVCVDIPDVLEVALPDDAVLQRTVVLFFCDVSKPATSVDAVGFWCEQVNARVTALLSENQSFSLRSARLDLCNDNAKALSSLVPKPFESSEVNEVTEIRSIETVCALPSMIVVTKMDLVESLPFTKVALGSRGEETTSIEYFRDSIRAMAISMGADLVFTSLSSSTGSQQFYRSLVAHLASVAAQPTKYPAALEGLSGAVRFDFTTATFIPCGVDRAASMPRNVALRRYPLSTIFPTSDTISNSGDARYETHQQILSTSWVAGSPGRRANAAVENTSVTGDDDGWSFVA